MLVLDEYNIYMLMQLGKKQGFLYYEEILSEFSNIDINQEKIDAIITIFENFGISVRKKEDDTLDNLETQVLDDIDIDDFETDAETNNNIKIYLNEISKIPLLSPEVTNSYK